MQEKLSWMSRSAARIRASLPSPIDVQDHFLSFAHASHLLFFYFGGWVKESGSGSTAKALVERYVASLEPKAAEVWKCLEEVRTEDVHVSPVKVANTQKPGILMLDGQELQFNGDRLMIGEFSYVVESAGSAFDVLVLCEVGLEVKRRFCDTFDVL